MSYLRHTYHGIRIVGTGDLSTVESHRDTHRTHARAMQEHLTRGTDGRTGAPLSRKELERLTKASDESQHMADYLQRAIDAFHAGRHDAAQAVSA